MSAPFLLTVDFELTGYVGGAQQRFPVVTHELLDWFAQQQIRATFFCVGEVLEKFPDLVLAIARQGHEIACHGWRHIPLDQLNPQELERDLVCFRRAMAALGLPPPQGYRAPFFSLTAQTRWAFAVIQQAGFVYDSSVVPARTLLHGYPQMGPEPRCMANGLWEIPVSVWTPLSRLGIRLGLPLCGGTYLRLLPGPLVGALQSSLPCHGQRPQVGYLHPYDLDTSLSQVEAFPGNPFYNSLLALGQGGMKKKINCLLQGKSSLTMGEWLGKNSPVSNS